MPLIDKEKKSKELVNGLAVLIKTAQIHNLNNISVSNSIKKILDTLNSLLSEDTVTLELVGEFFHVDGSRVRYSMDFIFNYDFLIKEFKKRQLGSIIFDDILNENDIRDMVKAIMSSGFDEEPYEVLFNEVEKIEHISIGPLRQVKEDGTEYDRKKIIKKTYFNAVSLTKNISKQISSGEKVSIKKVKRVMETIVNQIIEEESMLIGMTTIKDYDEYTYNHSVNVSVLAIALGHRIGLEKKTLTELGLSALLHDMGKTEVPKEILNKPVEFTEDDWKVIMQHPAWGAHAIFKMKGVDRVSMSAFISAFEHHLNYDLSGYPKVRNNFSLDLFSRIIAIDRKSTRLNSSHIPLSRMPSSA